MLTKAYIQEVISPHSVKVRMPLFNKIENVEGSTPNNELHSACVCSLPNFIINPRAGDVVIVGFEEDSIDKPVVLGYLSTASIKDSLVDVICDNLTVKGDTILDEFTSIGEVEPDNIKCLKNLRENVNDTFNVTRTQITNLYDRVDAADKGIANIRGDASADVTLGSLDSKIDDKASDLADDIGINKRDIGILDNKLTNYIKNHIKISTAQPTLSNVEEGQIYLWVQNG